jgi:hypothetical protein
VAEFGVHLEKLVQGLAERRIVLVIVLVLEMGPRW